MLAAPDRVNVTSDLLSDGRGDGAVAGVSGVRSVAGADVDEHGVAVGPGLSDPDCLAEEVDIGHQHLHASLIRSPRPNSATPLAYLDTT